MPLKSFHDRLPSTSAHQLGVQRVDETKIAVRTHSETGVAWHWLGQGRIGTLTATHSMKERREVSPCFNRYSEVREVVPINNEAGWCIAATVACGRESEQESAPKCG